jgi:hypothetical protein
MLATQIKSWYQLKSLEKYDLWIVQENFDVEEFTTHVYVDTRGLDRCSYHLRFRPIWLILNIKSKRNHFFFFFIISLSCREKIIASLTCDVHDGGVV